ncbi:MAG: TIGR00269 family protein, partial [Candidatus Micrarchaeota archaeon]
MTGDRERGTAKPGTRDPRPEAGNGKPETQFCHCGAEGAVFLHYASKHLCEEHFIRMFDKRFRKTVRMHNMLRKGDRVAVGLSGGKDSTVLLHSLAELKKDLPFEMVAVTIDEGIKGYRARTLGIARTECEKLGIEQVVLSFKDDAGDTLDGMMDRDAEHESGCRGQVREHILNAAAFKMNAKPETQNSKPDREKRGAFPWSGERYVVLPETLNPRPETQNQLPCTQCGVLRRYLLNKGAREAKATKLALGHNLDDMAQTVLMNIMRNEPARLARLYKPVASSGRFVERIRPLMLTPEKENALYAMMKGIDIEHVECPYARFAFRGHVRKMLNESEERYPGTKFKIVNAFLEIEGALRGKYADAALMECRSCGEPSSKELCMFCK